MEWGRVRDRRGEVKWRGEREKRERGGERRGEGGRRMGETWDAKED